MDEVYDVKHFVARERMENTGAYNLHVLLVMIWLQGMIISQKLGLISKDFSAS